MGSDGHAMLTADRVFLLTHKCLLLQERSTQAMLIREVCPQCKSHKYEKNSHIHNGKQRSLNFSRLVGLSASPASARHGSQRGHTDRRA
jgi:hypothetical protein